MKKIIIMITLSVALFGISLPQNHIVSTTWLEENISSEKLIIIDTRSEKEYKEGHLPKAISYPKKMWFQGFVGDITKQYNTPQQIETILQTVGYTKDKTIILYNGGKKEADLEESTSAFWNLWIYGVHNIALLNGGFEKWNFEKKPFTQEVVTLTPSDFEVETFDNSTIATIDDIIKAIYDEKIQIADARVAKFYRGEDDRKDLVRHGRIPTAKLTPMIRQVKKVNSYFEFQSEEESQKLLHNSGYGIELDQPLIVYCNTGAKARGLWFVTKFIAKMDDVKVYDASMVEYAKTLLPIETGESMD